MLQRTLVIIKPDISKNANTLNKVFQTFKSKNLSIVEKKKVVFDRTLAESFYNEHRAKFFYPRLVSFMLSGESIVCKVEGENAINKCRELIGPTHIQISRTQTPLSLRGEFAYSDTRNALHSSGK
eukprot:TRINITY_DN5780_c0_g1_i2.p1 TRINITY_DN5780_c0_g1~~TRINITY_DN5780_c0_g1_i2.p1  ORF type:complete len:142 (-),score=32.82 TRINITY_DN5780_c0_g1_i2:313-687(-)